MSPNMQAALTVVFVIVVYMIVGTMEYQDEIAKEEFRQSRMLTVDRTNWEY